MSIAQPALPARPGPVAVWWAAIRPKTLTAAVVPVAVGTAVAAAAGVVAWGPALAALVGALLIQVGCNLANDLYDFRKGADDADRVGPARATQKGWLSERQVAAGTVTSLAAAMLVGTYLVWVGGWPIVAIGISSVICAVAYTGGPFPLGYLGLGDVFVLVFFGPVAVLGTYWVQGLTLSTPAWVAAWPVGLLATAILVVNNLRDRHTDVRAGKKTLAVRFGATFARVEYAALVLGSYAVIGGAVAAGWVSLGWLLPTVTLPLAAVRIRQVWTTDGAALNPLLGSTAQLGMAFGALLVVGVLL